MMTASIFDSPHWFKLAHYDGTSLLDFEGWRSQIGTRVFLAGLLDMGMKEQFDVHFAQIASSPFMDIDFGDNYVSNKATYPLTFGVAEEIVNTLKPHAPHRKTNCDQMLSEIGQDSFAMQGHLTIDLYASKRQIIKNFEAWLEIAMEKIPRERNPGITIAVTKSWHDHQILPYQDLWLWHRRKKIDLPSHPILTVWLFPKTEHGNDKVRDTIKKAVSAFTLTTLRQLAIAAE